MKKEQNVLERVYEPGRLLEAWRQVKRNAGAAGVDQMTVTEFERRKEELFPVIRNKLIAGTYRFKPARRVSIPKEGSPGKFRNLGIPVVMDRIVAQSIHATLDEIYDPGFSQSNFGFRKGRSQHEAIRYVRETVKQGHRWCASVDLKSYFDEIPHNLVFKLIRRRIADERLVTLIARALKAGVVVEGKLEKTTKGVPQGSPLSPILSNIVLNEMDQELDRRELTYARWADDFVILLKSKRSAHRVMQRITRYLEETLGLPVNREKSEVALMREVTFLGFRIYRHRIRVSDQAIARFKRRVHALTHRNNPKSMQRIIEELFARVGELLSNPGVQDTVRQPGRLGARPATLDAAGQVEETQEVPAGDDPRGRTRVASPADMGGDEELAVGQSTRGVEGAQRRLVPKPGIGVPAGVLGGIDQLTRRSTLVVDRRAAYLAGTSRSVGRGWS
jgi:RNA-directed DNA polymerase